MCCGAVFDGVSCVSCGDSAVVSTEGVGDSHGVTVGTEAVGVIVMVLLLCSL